MYFSTDLSGWIIQCSAGNPDTKACPPTLPAVFFHFHLEERWATYVQTIGKGLSTNSNVLCEFNRRNGLRLDYKLIGYGLLHLHRALYMR